MRQGACFIGSFDPPTNGHLDLVARAVRVFGQVVVGVGKNAGKAALFTPVERVALLREALAPLGAAVEVDVCDGLATQFCRGHGMRVLVRGVRNVADFEGEADMAATNRELAPDIDTVLFYPSRANAHISSRLIREIAAAGGDLSRYLPAHVAQALMQKLKGPPA
jgi:pantetheine-phosphate adenylyltransferase